MKQQHLATSGGTLARRMMTLTVGLIALAFSTTVSFGDPAPQINATPLSKERARDQAPIGHCQPRVQDLPSGLQREQGAATAEQRALDKKLQICRQC
jgi:hypothetical protein